MSFNQRGFTLAGALSLIAVMSILLALAVPLWSRVKLRDNEEELIFRGKEYVEAITRYQQRFGAYPPDLETLQKLKFIRRLYPDPMTKSGKWKVIHPDSLIQTGEAGKINQPGKQESGDDDDDENNNQSKSLQPSDFGNQDKNDNESLNEDDSDEEPEVESTGPVVGVASRSKKTSIKVYNGQSAYNKWAFTFSVPQELQKVNPVPKPGTKSGANQAPGTNLKPGSFQSNPLPGQNPNDQGNPLPDPGDDDEEDEDDEER